MSDAEDRLKTALQDRYAIDRELGAGGMATVYLAHDLKHDRKVAIKVMRPELSAILGGERFLREVSIAAKLNHPHILALQDSGEAEEFLYYVMPYVEGESLREKLNREKQLSVDEAISITKQVGAALDYAHEQGVIHRDIKPENILIHQGEALVADFGIALAVSAAGGTRLTDTGLSLGTPEYMSPEQATGERELDARSDVYSLGAITYEMLVGEPPHTGNTVQAIIAKVVSAEPQPVCRVRHSVPSNVDAAVMCALAKTPADRCGSGADYTAALTNPSFASPKMSAVAAAPITEWSWNRLAVLFAALTTLFIVTTIWAVTRTSPTQPMPMTRISIHMPVGEEATGTWGKEIALSPDGRQILYVGPRESGQQLWLRPVDSLHARPLPGTELARDPFFSPDGSTIGFYTGSPTKIQVISIAGGPAVTVAEQARNRCGDWGPDGMIYFCLVGAGISRVPATGGEPTILTNPDTSRGELRHVGVDVLPSGKGALFTIWRGQFENADIAVVEFESGEVRQLVRGVHPLYASSGHLVYVRSDSMLMAAPFDQHQFRLTGPSVPLSVKVMLDMNGLAEVAISESGSLLYRVGDPWGALPIWVNRDGVERDLDPAWLDRMYYPALSPEGTRLAISIDGPDGRHIWVKTLDRGPLQRLTYESGGNQPAVWSQDGSSVTYAASTVGSTRRRIWRQRADGSSPATVVLEVEDYTQGVTWSNDGHWLIFTTQDADGKWDIEAIRPDLDSVPAPLVASEFDERSPALSPDSRWLTYSSNETGRFEVYARPFPNVADAKWQLSSAGGIEPLWAHNGRELFYITAQQELVVLEVETEPSFLPGSARVLFSGLNYQFWGWNHSYAVDRDDEEFVMLKAVDAENQETILVLNFFEELKQRVGNGND